MGYCLIQRMTLEQFPFRRNVVYVNKNAIYNNGYSIDMKEMLLILL